MRLVHAYHLQDFQLNCTESIATANSVYMHAYMCICKTRHHHICADRPYAKPTRSSTGHQTKPLFDGVCKACRLTTLAISFNSWRVTKQSSLIDRRWARWALDIPPCNFGQRKNLRLIWKHIQFVEERTSDWFKDFVRSLRWARFAFGILCNIVWHPANTPWFCLGIWWLPLQTQTFSSSQWNYELFDIRDILCACAPGDFVWFTGSAQVSPKGVRLHLTFAHLGLTGSFLAASPLRSRAFGSSISRLFAARVDALEALLLPSALASEDVMFLNGMRFYTTNGSGTCVAQDGLLGYFLQRATVLHVNCT